MKKQFSLTTLCVTLKVLGSFTKLFNRLGIIGALLQTSSEVIIFLQNPWNAPMPKMLEIGSGWQIGVFCKGIELYFGVSVTY